MTIKRFWIENKWNYLWSSLAFVFMAFFLGTIKKWGINMIALGSFIGVPLMFILSYGIYGLTGGDKE